MAAQGPEFTMHYLKLLRAAETRGKLEIDELKLDLVPIEVCEIYSLTTLSMQVCMPKEPYKRALCIAEETYY